MPAQGSAPQCVLVTGATGFVGRAVAQHLAAYGVRVRAATRGRGPAPTSAVEPVRTPPLEASGDWTPALAGCDAVVHAAARVHVMRDTSSAPLEEFRRVNRDGTLHLARSAAAAGVRRFVCLSSIKVNGEETQPGAPFRAADVPRPVDPYGVSKCEAETELLALARETGLEVAIIRPVLVYGPGVKGNFRAMLRAVHNGWPLPFGAVNNRRSLVGLSNLVELIATTLRHPNAAGRTFLVSDDHDLSTSELLRRVGGALGRRARLISVPPSLLRAGATALGKGDVARRLLGSLQVDISETRDVLQWAPPVTVDEQLAATAEWYLAQQHGSR